jgi:hypothetical protein
MELKKFPALNWAKEPKRLVGKLLPELAQGCDEFMFEDR